MFQYNSVQYLIGLEDTSNTIVILRKTLISNVYVNKIDFDIKLLQFNWKKVLN